MIAHAESAAAGLLCDVGLHVQGDVEVVDAAGHVRQWRLDCDHCEAAEEWWGVREPPSGGALFALLLAVYVATPVIAVVGGPLERAVGVSEA